MHTTTDMLGHAESGCEGIDGSSTVGHDREFRNMEGLTDGQNIVYDHISTVEEVLIAANLPGQLSGVPLGSLCDSPTPGLSGVINLSRSVIANSS
jgi:hypothetical protein